MASEAPKEQMSLTQQLHMAEASHLELHLATTVRRAQSEPEARTSSSKTPRGTRKAIAATTILQAVLETRNSEETTNPGSMAWEKMVPMEALRMMKVAEDKRIAGARSNLRLTKAVVKDNRGRHASKTARQLHIRMLEKEAGQPKKRLKRHPTSQAINSMPAAREHIPAIRGNHILKVLQGHSLNRIQHRECLQDN